MTTNAIQVQNVSKRYAINGSGEATLPEALARGASKLLRLGKRSSDMTPAKASEHWALRDVSFSIEPGQAIGIIGRNGAGKSTLLKILSRITHPTTGSVAMRGRVASLLEVGTGFHPELTGRENVFLNGTILGLSRREVKNKLGEIVEFSGIGEFLDTPIKHYSSGMTVRLAFAVAAHLEPAILIVDEVLAVGDAAFASKCLGKMKQVASSGSRTVLFVSHNMAAVQQLCSRAIVLDDGRIVGDGDPSDMVRKHLDLCLGSQSNSRDVTDRKRTGDLGSEVRFTRWDLLDAAGKPAPRLRFGEPITLDMSLHSKQSVQSVVFDLGIHTAEGTLLALVSTQQWPREITFEADKTFHARVRVEDLRLMPGSYCLSLAVRSVHTTLDHVPTAGAIEVTPEFFHAGIGPTQHRSLVHTLPTWELNRPDPAIDSHSAPPQSGTVILSSSAVAA